MYEEILGEPKEETLEEPKEKFKSKTKKKPTYTATRNCLMTLLDGRNIRLRKGEKVKVNEKDGERLALHGFVKEEK